MLENRVMPCLLMIDSGLYKTVQFKKPGYVGDPINAIKIFNDKEVDELVFLDITATEKKKEPNFKLIEDIASECFMPLAYGGGISTLDQAKRIYEIGVEKIALNNAAIHNPKLIEDIANIYGSQAVIVSIDYKKNVWGKVLVHGQRGKKSIGKTPEVFAKEMEQAGAGELLITSIDREGTWQGLDVEVLKNITDKVDIPVIANGGAGNLQHVEAVVKQGGASAVTLGSMSVYQKQGLGVLINFPKRSDILKVLN
jgi:cyclase